MRPWWLVVWSKGCRRAFQAQKRNTDDRPFDSLHTCVTVRYSKRETAGYTTLLYTTMRALHQPNNRSFIFFERLVFSTLTAVVPLNFHLPAFDRTSL